MAKPLSKETARRLTDREVAKILGGFLGGLCDMASVDDVKNAVEWWAETPEAWEMFRQMHGAESEEVRGEEMRICTQCRLGAHDHCVCTDCAVCAHRFDHDARTRTLAEVEEALIQLLSRPINLIPMTPTKEKETRDDMRAGMQRALKIVRELREQSS